MKKDIRQFLLEKEVKEYIINHKELFEDIEELCSNVAMFKIKYGVEITLSYDDLK